MMAARYARENILLLASFRGLADWHRIRRGEFQMQIPLPVFASRSPYRQNKPVVTDNLQQLCGAMKGLVLNLSAEGDYIDVGAARCRGYDSNILRS